MKHTLTTLAALIAMSGTALAQTPQAPAKPAKPAKPPQAASAPAVSREPSGDEELAIAALEGLMAQPSERALPIL